ncbi:MAG TPA: methyltransferase domain-containing protein [Kofleriaceae bacterium]|nr:methyltransferase domain-containing protein [Kofleriaceae bacterium]
MSTFDRREAEGGRLRLADHYDAELSRHNERLRAATGIGPADRVLDVGCGAGQSTRDAARAAVSGSALGVDVSEPMLERARRRSAEEGLHNVAYDLGDAQVHRFLPGHFDAVISRFGTMFFGDPVAAFANIARAARPGARLVMMVWQSHDRNEWASAIRSSLAGGDPPAQPPGAPDPFSLGDPASVESILRAAGFVDVGFTDVDEPVYYGPDTDAAHDLVRDMQMTRDLLAGLDPVPTERALARLRDTLAAHQTGDGVLFQSRSWIVTARRALTFAR